MIEYIALGYLLAAVFTYLQLYIILRDDIFEEFEILYAVILSSVFWPITIVAYLSVKYYTRGEE
jgi:hypothetical protein